MNYVAICLSKYDVQSFPTIKYFSDATEAAGQLYVAGFVA
eukprot:COSAG05_NODE_10705_length_550_cov_1.350333_1_plen_39_part_01